MTTDWSCTTLLGERIGPGESVDIRLKVSESYIADPISIPVTVIRGPRPGPTVFVTATIHGDELNGVGILRELLNEPGLDQLSGTLIVVPVANVQGFLNLERNLPDRRDLNRSFPGSQRGSLTSRIANTLFAQVVRPSDFGVDLHTGGGDRRNFPHVRADLSVPQVADLAHAFGCALVLNNHGPERSLRRSAVNEGIPTIAYEAGSARRLERAAIDTGLAGLHNVFGALGMLGSAPNPPPVRIHVGKTRWLRARVGGILDLRVLPGQPVETGEVLAVNTNPFGRERSQLKASFPGIVLGLSQSPVVHPGDAVCHLARAAKEELAIWANLWTSHSSRTLENIPESAFIPDH